MVTLKMFEVIGNISSRKNRSDHVSNIISRWGAAAAACTTT